jgi:hypothetical protein
MKNTEQLAAERILESGVRVKVPAPLFLRLFGKKEIGLLIKQPYLGTLMHISRLTLKAGFDFEGLDKGDMEAAHDLVKQHTGTICRILSVSVLNSRVKINLFGRFVAGWLKWKIKPRKLAEIIMTIILLSGVQDFTSSIRLIRSLKVTTPRNLSPKDQGSQKENKKASIAPGEQSGVSRKRRAGSGKK